jgi:hypothetical protein
MQTEFTCGIYTATLNSIGGPKWFVKIIGQVVALINEDGFEIRFTAACPPLSTESLIELTVLMTNIKRQHRQLQTNS